MNHQDQLARAKIDSDLIKWLDRAFFRHHPARKCMVRLRYQMECSWNNERPADDLVMVRLDGQGGMYCFQFTPPGDQVTDHLEMDEAEQARIWDEFILAGGFEHSEVEK